ncbi:MAG: hypothetical protein L0K30_12860, partial [Acidipropionibacterium jensenii]
MAADRRRPATPDDVLNALEALTASNAELRSDIRRLESTVARMAGPGGQMPSPRTQRPVGPSADPRQPPGT